MNTLLKRAAQKIISEDVYKLYKTNNKNFDIDKFLEDNLSYLNSYVNNIDCSKCASLKLCKNNLIGLQVKLFYDNNNNKLYFSHVPCEKYINYKNNITINPNFWINHSLKKQKQFDFSYVKELVSNQNLIDITDEKRLEEINRIFNFCISTVQNLSPKYCYVTSKSNVCKTTIAIAFCNEFIKKYPRKKVAYIKIPRLLQEIRYNPQSFRKISSNDIIDYLSKCDLLVIDDLGLESFYQWFHIEILYNVFEMRMADNTLVTYIFSKYDLNELKNSYVGNYRISSVKDKINEFINKMKDFQNVHKGN